MIRIEGNFTQARVIGSLVKESMTRVVQMIGCIGTGWSWVKDESGPDRKVDEGLGGLDGVGLTIGVRVFHDRWFWVMMSEGLGWLFAGAGD